MTMPPGTTPTKGSHTRVRILLGTSSGKGVNFGCYGLGQSRSLLDYEEFAGIDFKKRISLL
jgi:hypothetical protein